MYSIAHNQTYPKYKTAVMYVRSCIQHHKYYTYIASLVLTVFCDLSVLSVYSYVYMHVVT